MNEQSASALRSPWIAGLALVLLTIAAYLPAIGAGYIWDDDDYLTHNALVQQWDALPRIWEPMQTRQYYPLVFTTFWVEHKLWGLEPAGYHLVNILLHALSAILVWRIARWLRIPGAGAWFIAAVFALHPVHVESVAWITERKNVLSGVLYLSAMVTYLRFDRMRARGQADWWFYGLALVFFAGALFSKTVTASLPVAIVIILLFKRESLSVARLWPLVPMLLIGLVLGLNTAYVERVNVGAVGPEFEFSFIERCLIASRALLFYPWKLAVPWPLCFFYERWKIDAGAALQYAPIALLLVAFGVLVWLWMRGLRWPMCAAAFFAVTIFPAIGFVSVYPMRYSFVADHFQYLASLGIIAGAVGGVAWLLRGKSWAWIPGACVLLIFGVLTFRQTHNYKNEEALWRATIQCNPTSWAALNNLGSVLLRQSDRLLAQGNDASATEHLREAESHLREALALKPDHSRARAQLSEVLRVHGRFDEALAQMRQSHEDLVESLAGMNAQRRERAAYEIAESHYQLARLYNLLDQHDDAAQHYRAAVHEYPGFSAALMEWATMLAEDEKLDAAAERYRDLLVIAPGHSTAHMFLGDYERDQGNWNAALEHYQAVANLNPSFNDQLWAFHRMARLLATCPDESIRNGSAAIHLAERVVDATQRQAVFPLATLAMAYAELRDFDRAIAVAEEAIALAQQLGMTDAIDELNAQLESYRAGQPWRMQLSSGVP